MKFYDNTPVILFSLNNPIHAAMIEGSKFLGLGTFKGKVEPTWIVPVKPLEVSTVTQQICELDGQGSVLYLDNQRGAHFVNPTESLYAGRFVKRSLEYITNKGLDWVDVKQKYYTVECTG